MTTRPAFKADSVTAAVLGGSVLVLARSAVFVLYEQAHFDSDQAVVGLMAHHIAGGVAYPIYFYGQHYLLAIEAWLAAPFLLLFGTSVAALKAPLVALNLLLVALLIRLLVRDAGLRPWQALAASLFVALPPPVAASRLVEAQGGNVEPLVFALLLWMVRLRPWGFGGLLGLAFLNREFVLFAAVAWALVALLHDGWRPAAVRTYTLRAGLAFAAVLVVVAGLHAIGSPAGAVHEAPRLGWIGGVAIARNFVSLVGTELPVLLGVARVPLREFNVASSLIVGAPWLVVVLGLLVAAGVAAVGGPRSLRNHPRVGFSLYLCLVGIQVGGARLLVPGIDAMQLRYLLLTLFVPVGIAAVALDVRARAWPAALVLGGTLAWTGASLFDHARLMTEYAGRRPPNAYRELAENLEARGVHYARADYWTAYYVTFLTAERVIVVPDAVSRIPHYEWMRAEEATEVSVIQDLSAATAPCDSALRLRRWQICG